MAVTRAVTAAALHLRGSGWLCSEPLAHVIVMACYTAEDVAHLFEEDGAALDSVCMDGSDDELGLEDVIRTITTLLNLMTLKKCKVDNTLNMKYSM